MTVEQIIWTPKNQWEMVLDQGLEESAQLVLAFGSRSLLEDDVLYAELSSLYPNAELVSCTTAGSILQDEVLDDSLVVNAIHFEKTNLRVIELPLTGNTYSTAKELFSSLTADNLQHIMLFTDGTFTNGTELTLAIDETLTGVTVNGGFAADGITAERTLIGLNNPPKESKMVAVGLYGTSLKISSDVGSGWNTFGVKRQVTESSSNIVTGIEGAPALDLFESFLGTLSDELPSSGMLIPIGLIDDNSFDITMAGLVDVDRRNKSLIFNQNIPEGSSMYFMKADTDSLVLKAGTAASQCLKKLKEVKPEFAFLVSSLGRKMTMRQWTEDELEEINTQLSGEIPISGFYGHGEISPHRKYRSGEVHSHCIAVTLFCEL
ncbi:MAG: FIST signal transduction protein [Cyclobacteriaceae bacterium]